MPEAVSPEARWADIPSERRNAVAGMLRAMGDDARTDPRGGLVHTAVAIDLYAAADMLDLEGGPRLPLTGPQQGIGLSGCLAEVESHLRRSTLWETRGDVARATGLPSLVCGTALEQLVRKGLALVERRGVERVRLYYRHADAEASHG